MHFESGMGTIQKSRIESGTIYVVMETNIYLLYHWTCYFLPHIFVIQLSNFKKLIKQHVPGFNDNTYSNYVQDNSLGLITIIVMQGFFQRNSITNWTLHNGEWNHKSSTLQSLEKTSMTENIILFCLHKIDVSKG